jgi:hypothetical protein
MIVNVQENVVKMRQHVMCDGQRNSILKFSIKKYKNFIPTHKHDSLHVEEMSVCHNLVRRNRNKHPGFLEVVLLNVRVIVCSDLSK